MTQPNRYLPLVERQNRFAKERRHDLIRFPAWERNHGIVSGQLDPTVYGEPSGPEDVYRAQLAGDQLDALWHALDVARHEPGAILQVSVMPSRFANGGDGPTHNIVVSMFCNRDLPDIVKYEKDAASGQKPNRDPREFVKSLPPPDKEDLPF